MAAKLRSSNLPDKAFASRLALNYFMPSQALVWHNMAMVSIGLRCSVVGSMALALLMLVAGSSFATPRLERERCTFKPPRGDRIECFVLTVPENREQPEGREVRLKIAILKAKRTASAEPLFYLSGGPGDAPLVAANPGADALSEGDWWNETAGIRRHRDVVIVSQRGAGGSTPNLDCFDPRTSDSARARRRAVTEQQEREVLASCRAAFDEHKIDLSMYSTPALADDVADLASAMSLQRINIYGVSYGTRWALEVMRRHPGLVRAAVLDGVYPPEVNGEQGEPEIVRHAFEQLYADCNANAFCRRRYPGLRGQVEGSIEGAEHKPIAMTLQLDDGPQAAQLDGAKLLMVLLHMMREGEVALIPEAVAAGRRGDLRILTMFAEDLESSDGGLLEENAQQFDGLYNSVECRETWSAVDAAARVQMIETNGVYGFNARTSKSPTFCPAWRVPAAPAAERQPVQSSIPTLLLSGTFDWLTPPAWARDAARYLASSRQVVFRSQGHGVAVQDPCAARLRDAFIDEPDPKRPPSCRFDAPPNFAAAVERARNLP
jgi:pimeloyl-ACP methyl ester carboxylesterase